MPNLIVRRPQHLAHEPQPGSVDAVVHIGAHVQPIELRVEVAELVGLVALVMPGNHRCWDGSFAKNCRSLKKLSCGSCNFGAKGINAILNNSASLEELPVKRFYRRTQQWRKALDGNPKNPAAAPPGGTTALRLSTKKQDERVRISMELTKVTADE
ncbi:unnamed protein product [Linum trigynum]|uniref:Uncharacterized protein n=1 Tax=Linum trigynum TaxID=586398 RepID=A0AAV2FAE6_9ROSI